MTFLIILIGYSVLMIALGVIVSRQVRQTSDFFVAGRSLSAGLLFSTFLAANIGAGSTVGATGLGYRLGFAAWWWVGSAGLGSLVLAFIVGPRIWKIASENGLYTVGDFLEFRFDRRVRAFVAILLWVGSLAILAGQLIAIAWILNVTAGLSKPLGCAIGALVTTTYFAAGGLHSAARVNVVQLAVKLIGFALAFIYLLPAITQVGSDRGPPVATGIANPETFFSFFGDGSAPAKYLVLLAPSFIISPGLLQKTFGARDERSVRLGIGLNAVCLLLFAFIPPALGVLARMRFPGLLNSELALPTVMTEALPFWLGGILLAAIFSAEVSAADAVLFMLSTSLGKDLYQTFLNPKADDRQLVRMVRGIAIGCGVLGALVAAVIPDVISALTIFYTLLSAALFLPLLGGLFWRPVTSGAALMAMLASVAVTVVVERLTGGGGYAGIPSLIFGIAVGAVAMLVVIAVQKLKQ